MDEYDDHQHTPPAATSHRDSSDAIRRAEERVALAVRAAAAVEAFHAAADKLEHAARTKLEASSERSASLREMRSAGLPVSEISTLTGLSPSRITAILSAGV